MARRTILWYWTKIQLKCHVRTKTTVSLYRAKYSFHRTAQLTKTTSFSTLCYVPPCTVRFKSEKMLLPCYNMCTFHFMSLWIYHGHTRFIKWILLWSASRQIVRASWPQNQCHVLRREIHRQDTRQLLRRFFGKKTNFFKPNFIINYASMKTFLITKISFQTQGNIPYQDHTLVGL